MHSSRMRTGRPLTVCCSLLPGGRGSAPGGVVCSGGVSAPRGVWSQGGVCSRGGGVCSRGVSAPGGLLLGGCIPACTEADTLPPCGQNS